MLVVTRTPAVRMHPSPIRQSPPTVAIGWINTSGRRPASLEQMNRGVGIVDVPGELDTGTGRVHRLDDVEHLSTET
ncbi:MAG: hypothetical protein WCA57_14420, partial [Ilumatobacteraceae bacterium]